MLRSLVFSYILWQVTCQNWESTKILYVCEKRPAITFSRGQPMHADLQLSAEVTGLMSERCRVLIRTKLYMKVLIKNLSEFYSDLWNHCPYPNQWKSPQQGSPVVRGRSNSSGIDAATPAGIVPLQTMATPTHDTSVCITNFHYSNHPSCFLISDTNKEQKQANILSC